MCSKGTRVFGRHCQSVIEILLVCLTIYHVIAHTGATNRATLKRVQTAA